MGLLEITHGEDAWADRAMHRRYTTGAWSYSRDIVKHHLPIWRDALAGYDATISTCPLMDARHEAQGGVPIKGDVFVQYLHDYYYTIAPALTMPKGVVENARKHGVERVVFVTWSRQLHERMTLAGYESIHLPMTVDTTDLQPYRRTGPPTIGRPRIAYFVSVLTPRRKTTMRRVINRIKDAGWQPVRIAGSQAECWEALSQFQYGLGACRCAIEMHALGLKVMYASAIDYGEVQSGRARELRYGIQPAFGGIATNEVEYGLQSDSNFDARVVTFDSHVESCLEAFDLAVDYEGQNDIDVSVKRLETILADWH